MPRDYRKLTVFAAAAALVEDVYRLTQAFPGEERYGLQAQIRRAAVSVPTNIVEGSARRSVSEYLRFVEISYASSREAGYLLMLSARLHLMGKAEANALAQRYDAVQAGLYRLTEALNKRRR